MTTLAKARVTLDVVRLRAAIKASGLSATAYARQVLMRNPRTLRRWVAGTSPIPEAVREFLRRKPH